MRNKVELLAPAGGERQFISAVENGADAVYVGGSLYNARINAENFDKAQMQSAIDYAHKRGVKVNVTMNTLVADDELAGALDYAVFLYEAGADALIIQDLGLGSVIRKASRIWNFIFRRRRASATRIRFRSAGIWATKESCSQGSFRLKK